MRISKLIVSTRSMLLLAAMPVLLAAIAFPARYTARTICAESPAPLGSQGLDGDDCGVKAHLRFIVAMASLVRAGLFLATYSSMIFRWATN